MAVTLRQRAHMVELMRYLVSKEPQVHYAQVRPMATRLLTEASLRSTLDGGSSITMDCSEAVTLICRLAGLKNPNGTSYSTGTGFTGDMLHNLPHYFNPSKAGRGAIVIFGDAPGHHACQVMEVGADPLLFSHGTERGPLALRLSQEKQYHLHEPVTFLNISGL